VVFPLAILMGVRKHQILMLVLTSVSFSKIFVNSGESMLLHTVKIV
jgi:hypothetical protein